MEEHGDFQIPALNKVLHVPLSNIDQARATQKRKHKRKPEVMYLLPISILQKMEPP